jgi:RNA polymerase-binding transcription factor DksA
MITVGQTATSELRRALRTPGPAPATVEAIEAAMDERDETEYAEWRASTLRGARSSRLAMSDLTPDEWEKYYDWLETNTPSSNREWIDAERKAMRAALKAVENGRRVHDEATPGWCHSCGQYAEVYTCETCSWTYCWVCSYTDRGGVVCADCFDETSGS